MTHILIVDDHPIFRRGLRTMLRVTPGVDEISEAAGAQECLDVAVRLRPDVILLDIRLPGESGIAILPRLREAVPESKVLLVTAHEEPEYLRMGIEAGADGFLMKSASQRELAEAIEQVLKGRRVIDRHFGQEALDHLSEHRRIELTQRETAVLRLLATGLSNKEIARQLDLSVDTVKFHLKAIFRKFGAADRTQAVMAAVRLGLVATQSAPADGIHSHKPKRRH